MSVTRITPWAVNGPAANYGVAASLSGASTNVPAGALIVTSVEAHPTTTPTVSDTAGNTYTVVLGETSSSYVSIWFAYCLSAIANSANVITWNQSSSALSGAQGAVYTTSSGTWAFDKSVSGLSAYATALTLPSLTTAAAGVIFGGFGEYYKGADTWSITGLTAQASQAGSSTGNGTIGCLLADDITSAAVSGLSIVVSDANGGYGGRIAGIAASFVVSGAPSTNNATVAASATPKAAATASQSQAANLLAGASPTALGQVLQYQSATVYARSAPSSQVTGALVLVATVTGAANPQAVAVAAQTLAASIQASADPSAAVLTLQSQIAQVLAYTAPGFSSSVAQTNAVLAQVLAYASPGTFASAYDDFSQAAARFAAVQAASPQFYTGIKPAQAQAVFFLASGTWTVPPGTHFYLSATAAGGTPLGSAGRQVLGQSLPVSPGDVLTVTIGPGVTVAKGATTLASLLDGLPYAKGTAGGLPQDSGIQGLGSGADSGPAYPACVVFYWR